MAIYGKLIGGKMFEAPNILNKDGKQYINPPEEMYLEFGYLPLKYTTIPDLTVGYHLVQSWINIENSLVQKWNYEADEKENTTELIKKIRSLEKQILSTPINYIQGMEVDEKKLYTDGKIIVKAIASGTPKNFNDINFFA